MRKGLRPLADETEGRQLAKVGRAEMGCHIVDKEKGKQGRGLRSVKDLSDQGRAMRASGCQRTEHKEEDSDVESPLATNDGLEICDDLDEDDPDQDASVMRGAARQQSSTRGRQENARDQP